MNSSQPISDRVESICIKAYLKDGSVGVCAITCPSCADGCISFGLDCFCCDGDTCCCYSAPVPCDTNPDCFIIHVFRIKAYH